MVREKPGQFIIGREQENQRIDHTQFHNLPNKATVIGPFSCRQRDQ
jgi:hypothetical protein